MMNKGTLCKLLPFINSLSSNLIRLTEDKLELLEVEPDASIKMMRFLQYRFGEILTLFKLRL